MTACLGTRWRYKENAFINSKGELVFQKRIRQLKTKSCNEKCQPQHNVCQSDFVDELLSQFISDTGEMPELPDGVKDGDELILKYSAWEGEIENVWFEISEDV